VSRIITHLRKYVHDVDRIVHSKVRIICMHKTDQTTTHISKIALKPQKLVQVRLKKLHHAFFFISFSDFYV